LLAFWLSDLEPGLHTQLLRRSEVGVALGIDVAFRLLCNRNAAADQRRTQNRA